MIPRRAYSEIQTALKRQAAVGLIGPRQAGKTTLAIEIAKGREGSIYLDLESRDDRSKLAEPSLFLPHFEDRLVVLDEIHRVPELFGELRGIIDRSRRQGKRTGRFLIVGSASINLLRQAGESLAGRIEYVRLNPLDVQEATSDSNTPSELWVRGGFPDSLLANSEADSYAYRQNLIDTYLERYVPQFGGRMPAETLGRLWTMLAHNQGAQLNASKLAANLSVSAPTVSTYIDLLVDLLLVRRLTPQISNTGKRLAKSPKVYIRDSGLVHALLGIRDHAALSGHPVVGASWEGFVIENLLAACPAGTQSGFYRTAAAAEADLVLALPGGTERWVIAIRLGSPPKVTRGFHHARRDLNATRSFVVYSGEDRYPIAEGVEVIGLRQMAALLARA